MIRMDVRFQHPSDAQSLLRGRVQNPVNRSAVDLSGCRIETEHRIDDGCHFADGVRHEIADAVRRLVEKGADVRAHLLFDHERPQAAPPNDGARNRSYHRSRASSESNRNA
jgi:hypothetical protein